jgi:hypothetical protein
MVILENMDVSHRLRAFKLNLSVDTLFAHIQGQRLVTPFGQQPDTTYSTVYKTTPTPVVTFSPDEFDDSWDITDHNTTVLERQDHHKGWCTCPNVNECKYIHLLGGNPPRRNYAYLCAAIRGN